MWRIIWQIMVILARRNAHKTAEAVLDKCSVRQVVPPKDLVLWGRPLRSCAALAVWNLVAGCLLGHPERDTWGQD